jgi:DNA-directed RNA polymerase specialized sigma24 family protein
MHMVSGAVLQKWSALTDEQLVLHVLSGRTALYELLIRRHGERLYRTIRAIVGTDTQAESLLEDTFVHAYAHLRRIPKDTAFVAWLSRVAIQTATRARLARDPFRNDRRPTSADGTLPLVLTSSPIRLPAEEDTSGESRKATRTPYSPDVDCVPLGIARNSGVL